MAADDGDGATHFPSAYDLGVPEAVSDDARAHDVDSFFLSGSGFDSLGLLSPSGRSECGFCDEESVLLGEAFDERLEIFLKTRSEGDVVAWLAPHERDEGDPEVAEVVFFAIDLDGNLCALTGVRHPNELVVSDDFTATEAILQKEHHPLLTGAPTPPMRTSVEGKAAPFVDPKVGRKSLRTGVPTAPRYFSVGELVETLSSFDVPAMVHLTEACCVRG
jgi:hypothetical protein